MVKRREIRSLSELYQNGGRPPVHEVLLALKREVNFDWSEETEELYTRAIIDVFNRAVQDRGVEGEVREYDWMPNEGKSALLYLEVPTGPIPACVSTSVKEWPMVTVSADDHLNAQWLQAEGIPHQYEKECDITDLPSLLNDYIQWAAKVDVFYTNN